MKNLIAIDPGKSGAIVWVDSEGAHAQRMPATMAEQGDFLRSLAAAGLRQVVLERVGGYMPGNSGPASVKFARHVGNLEALLYMCGIAVVENPTPAQWMKRTGCPTGLEKKARKDWLLDYAARRFPDLKVTKTNADALAMLFVYMGD